MESLERRLRALEANSQQQGYKVPRRVERYMHILKNYHRRTRGLEPLPELPYTQEDYEDDLRTLHEHIPRLRASPGWQRVEARARLDSWEVIIRERMENR